MGFGKKDKDPFESLDPAWKTSIESMPEELIRKLVSEIALERKVFQDAKRADIHLKELGEEKAKLQAPYKQKIEEADDKVRYAKTFLTLPLEIQQQISEAAFNREQTLVLMKADHDLIDKTDECKEAAAGYVEKIKGATLMIRYALSILQARGKA